MYGLLQAVQVEAVVTHSLHRLVSQGLQVKFATQKVPGSQSLQPPLPSGT